MQELDGVQLGARIKVVGVGGGGGNAVNTMIAAGLQGVDFMTANTSFGSTDTAANETTAFSATSVSISLTAKDLPSSLAWYRDVLGFAVVNEMVADGALRAAVVQAGAARIILNQDDGGRGWTR